MITLDIYSVNQEGRGPDELKTSYYYQDLEDFLNNFDQLKVYDDTEVWIKLHTTKRIFECFADDFDKFLKAQLELFIKKYD